MGTARKYVVIDPATGKLDRRIFSDEAIYDDEMEKIFGRAWLMIGHESLVPAADDFFHTYMGEDPVILTRDGEGRLHALLNMCRHRGNRVVRCDDGNDGALEYAPGEAQAYYDALDRPSLSLIAARVETYAGIVFATWAKDAAKGQGRRRSFLEIAVDHPQRLLGKSLQPEYAGLKIVRQNRVEPYSVPRSPMIKPLPADWPSMAPNPLRSCVSGNPAERRRGRRAGGPAASGH
jgi:phenylpropionate dioxygenase-like ring-hydroxylating dioxygenase large terminal subunit